MIKATRYLRSGLWRGIRERASGITRQRAGGFPLRRLFRQTSGVSLRTLLGALHDDPPGREVIEHEGQDARLRADDLGR